MIKLIKYKWEEIQAVWEAIQLFYYSLLLSLSGNLVFLRKLTFQISFAEGYSVTQGGMTPLSHFAENNTPIDIWLCVSWEQVN